MGIPTPFLIFVAIVVLVIWAISNKAKKNKISAQMKIDQRNRDIQNEAARQPKPITPPKTVIKPSPEFFEHDGKQLPIVADFSPKDYLTESCKLGEDVLAKQAGKKAQEVLDSLHETFPTLRLTDIRFEEHEGETECSLVNTPNDGMKISPYQWRKKNNIDEDVRITLSITKNPATGRLVTGWEFYAYLTATEECIAITETHLPEASNAQFMKALNDYTAKIQTVRSGKLPKGAYRY